MKEFIDRQPVSPGRRKITHEDGSSEYVTMEMADDPVVVGTPLNRNTFMELQGFTNDNTTVSRNGDVTTVTTTEENGGTTVTKITKLSATQTKVVTTYTGPNGYVNTKEITITRNGNNVTIGGVSA